MAALALVSTGGSNIAQALVEGARRPRVRAALLITGIVLIGANLRPAITSVGPLVEQIRFDTGLSAAAAGLLTTLPVLGFGLFALGAAMLGRRLGLEAALLASLLILAGGIGIRAVPGIAPLFVGTMVLGVGIAIANVLLPALVKRDFPQRLGAMTALYSSLLGGFGAIGSGVAVPLADGTALGWRGALAIWAVPAVIAAIAWAPQLTSSGNGREMPEPVAAPGDAWRSRLGWEVTLFFGVQAFGFYVTIAWLPTILIDAGLSEARAGAMLFLLQIGVVASMLVFPQIADRAADQRRLVAVMATLALTGAVGLLVAGAGAAVLWVALLGLGQGGGMALALMFFVLRSRDAHQAAELSGMAQGVGYTLAASGPVVAGLLHDATSSWTPVPVMLVAVAVGLLGFGMRAGRPVVIEVEQRRG